MLNHNAGRSLDAALLDRSTGSSLVEVARERRLVLESTTGALHIDLNWVDEAAMTLVDQAIQSVSDLSLLYPTPAGDVGVLVAAQFLLGRLVAGQPRASVGLVTADPVKAARIWSQLSLATAGARRTRLEEAYPAYVADRDGGNPLGRRAFKGLIIGDRANNWNVDFAIVDRLAGRAMADFDVPTLRLYADPLDPDLDRDQAAGRPIWAWSRETLAADNDELERDTPGTVPFSVSHARLATMSGECAVTVHAIDDGEIETLLQTLRDDLRCVSDSLGPRPPKAVTRGLQIAWHHVNTLATLPCRPSRFDAFSGLPPFAARATHTFSLEIAAWARSLNDDLRELAQVVASDVEDLRWAMEEKNPYKPHVVAAMEQRGPGLAVFKTRTAAKGFLMEQGEDPAASQFGGTSFGLMRSVHRSTSHAWALFTGLPAPWEWYRLGGGLTRDLHLMVVGGHDAQIAQRRLNAIDEARSRWASYREDAWRFLFRSEPPESAVLEPSPRRVAMVGEAASPAQLEPLDFIHGLLRTEPIRVGREGPEESVAALDETGRWATEVEALCVETDAGLLFLGSTASVEVLEGGTIQETAAIELRPGQRLIVGRSEGRLGLLEALEDQLRAHRPDLLAARLLADSLHRDVVNAFQDSELSRASLHERLKELGCVRVDVTTASWVDPAGPMAPRHEADLNRLAAVLELDYSDTRIRESFAAVKRIRQFRRNAGRALADMASSALTAQLSSAVDARIGLSLRDLRNAVIEATVIAVTPAETRVPVTRLGRLEQSE